MSQNSNGHLVGSWIVDDMGDEDEAISWDEDTASVGSLSSKRELQTHMTDEQRTRHRDSPNLRHTTSQPDPELVMPTLMQASSPSQGNVRKRKPSIPTRMPPPQRFSETIPERRSPRRVPRRPATSTFADQILDLLGHIARWLWDVLGGALNAVKKPISWFVAIYLFAGLITMLQTLLTSSLYTALSPVCRIPGVSLLHLPICQYSSPGYDAPTISSSNAPVEFDALMRTQSHFEEIMAESAAGVSLPMDMKRSETSIRDLRQIVRHSQLASRNELVLEFDGFIETARMASYDLQKFNSHVGRGVDMVLSTARWTQRVLDDMDVKQTSRGLLPSFFQDRLLAPFRPVQFNEDRLLDQYIQHTRIVSDEIERLLDEAQALLQVLQNLEDRLDVIHSVALHDNVAAQASKDEILTHLWTLLGGNRAQLGKYNKQLSLLRQVGRYRQLAWAHVSATILKLQAMGAELEELRTRVGSAEVLKHHKEIPLSVHVENIRLGVERLEEGRTRAKELEQKHVRRVLDGLDDHMKLVGSN